MLGFRLFFNRRRSIEALGFYVRRPNSRLRVRQRCAYGDTGMVTEAAILAIVTALPVCYADRDDPRKPEQLATISRAVTEVANASRRPIDKAAKLLTTGYHETRFCLAVHSGTHRGPGRGSWQLEGQGRRHSGPFVGLSYEATLNAARVAGHIMDYSYQCGSSAGDVFTAYAGKPCGSSWRTLADRVRTYRWISWRLAK